MTRSKHHRRRVSGKRPKPAGITDRHVLVAFLVLVLFIVIILSNTSPGSVSTEREKDVLLNKLVIEGTAEDGSAIVVGDVLDEERLQQLAQTDYNVLKQELGVKADFVVYFEDNDGNLIEVANKPCIGSEYGQINGQRCS